MTLPKPRALTVLFFLSSLLACLACAASDPSEPVPSDGDSENEAESQADLSPFVVAVLADSHIIDEYYHGTESTPLDTSSLQNTSANLSAMSEILNGYEGKLPLKHIVIVGDIIHNLPFAAYDDYQSKRTRLDNAHDVLAKFKTPVHLLFGNHDYDLSQLDIPTTHRLFKEKLGMEPYSSFEEGGFRFILLNDYLGSTCNTVEAPCDKNTLGQEQLAWLKEKLADKKPTLLFMHVMLSLMSDDEDGQPGLLTLLKENPQVKMVLSGHTHNWISLGKKYGPDNWVVASTRYGKEAVMLLEINPKSSRVRFLNEACITKYSYETRRYDHETGACREE